MPKTVDRLLVLGLDGATWSVLDPMRQRGLMPNLDALLAGAASRDAALDDPAGHDGRLDHDDDRLRAGAARRLRPPLLRRRRRADEGQPLGPDPRPDRLAPALRHRAIDRLASTCRACIRRSRCGGSSSRAWMRRISQPPSRPRPSSPPGCEAEAPGYGLGYFWKRAPQSLEELTTNARLTAESFRGRADGGWLADRIVPDWSVLMVQFQNLDPFQHRVWPYLNVDETGVDRPDWNAAAAEVIRGLDEAIGRLCELAGKRGAGGDGRQRPRLRPVPGPHPRQPHPGRGRRGPAARAGPG